MAGSITVDISARITGYQDSLKQLQAAFAKVDPGSAIGKKLANAIEQAKKQVTDLGKNMFPKASSDSQIDAIAEKVNRVGVALQHVSDLFQGLNIGDLNFKALTPEIANAAKEMEQLQNTVNATMNGGIQQAIANSDQLNAAFKSLGVNIKSITADNGGDILAKGLSNAEQEAEKAGKAYEKVLAKAQAAQEKLDSIQANPYSSKNFNKEEVMGKLLGFDDPARIINENKLKEIQERVGEVLNNFKGQGSANAGVAQKLIDQFFGDINPSTTIDQFRTKFDELCNQLKSQGFTTQGIARILGTTKSENIFDEIFNLDAASAETKSKLTTLMNSLFDSLNFNGKQRKVINDLIDRDQFENAVEEAKKIIEEGYKKINETEQKAIETNNSAAEKLNAAKGIKDTAEARRDSLSVASSNYSKIESELRAKVEAQENRIQVLQNTVQQLTQGELGKILSGTTNAGVTAGKQVFPVEEARTYGKELEKINSAQQFVGKLQGITQRWFSVYAAVRMVSRAIKTIISNTKELDATITEIAIVTNKSQDDLWGQMPQYIEMAKKYGASISGAYKVSQLYYQQGLGQEDVMALSEQTLKMARISGLDYAQATDYMTNAVRSFKLEMQDAQTVVDTYSAVAAASATSVSELATAMSKTASSAQSVGASIQNTTAMMAVMIEATRESPENIGSAMKSIISRYGELKENKTGIDEEGEEYSLNKVDKALQTVGISIHDAQGEFRDFDDVIFELAEHWNEIDKNTQRYIATIMAGNRQQSRFLALVSSGERLKELSRTAADSEDASQMQFLKTLDSIEYKSQQMQNSLQSLYANNGVQNLIKSTLDGLTNIIDSFNNMSTAFNTPIAAIAKFGVQFANIARIVTTTFGLIKTGVAAQIDAIRSSGIAKAQQAADQEVQIEKNKNQQILNDRITTAAASMRTSLLQANPNMSDAEITKALANAGLIPTAIPTMGGASAKPGLFQKGGLLGKGSRGLALTGLAASMAGSYLSMAAMNMGESPEELSKKALLTGAGSVLTGVGMGSMFGPVGAAIGGVVGLVAGVVQASKISYEDAEEKTARLKKELETAKNENISKKNEYKTLKSTIDEYEKLEQTHLDSAEAAQEYIDKCNQIAEEHPDLVSSYDAEGNAVINLVEAYNKLAIARADANESAENEVQASITLAHNETQEAVTQLNKSIEKQKMGNIIEQSNFDSAYTINDVNDILERISAQSGFPIEQFSFGGQTSSALQADLIQAAMNSNGNLDLIEDVLGKYSDFLSDSGVRQRLEASAPQLYRDIIYPLIDSVKKEGENLSTADKEVQSRQANVDQKRSAERAQVAVGAQSLSQGYIQELLLQDKISNVNKYRSLKEFENASLLGGRFLTSQYSLLNGEQQQNYFESGKAKEDFNAYTDALNQFWENNSKKNKQLLEDLVQNQGNYTFDEMSNALKGLGIEELYEDGGKNPIYQAIIQYYQDATTTASDILTLTFNAKGKTDKNGYIGKIIRDGVESLDSEAVNDHWTNRLGESEKYAVSSFYNTILDAIDNNTISEKIGTQITGAYVNAWKILTSEELDIDDKTRNAAQKLLTEIDFTDVDGIQNFIEGLEELGLTLEQLKLTGLKNIKLPSNFSAKIQTFTENTTTQLTNFDKDLSSVTKGMDFSDANKMAIKLGASLNSFKQVGNKFYLEDYQTLKDYYFKERDKQIKELQDARDNELKNLEGFSYGDTNVNLNTLVKGIKDESSAFSQYGKTIEERIDGLFNNTDIITALDKALISPDRLKTQIQDYIEHNKGEDFLSYMKEHFADEYKAYVETSNEALAYSIGESYLKHGQIDSFVDYIVGPIKTADDFMNQVVGTEDQSQREIAQAMADEANTNREKLINAISTGDLDSITDVNILKYADTILSTYKDVNTSINNAIFEALEGGQNQLAITDINRTAIKKLYESHTNWFELPEGQTIDNAQYIKLMTSAIEQDEEGFKTLLDTQSLTRKQRAEYMKQWHDIHYPDPAEIASKMITSSDYLSYDAGQDLWAALAQNGETTEDFYKNLGITMTDTGGHIIDRTKYIEELNKRISEVSDPEQKRKLEAELASAERTRITQSKIDTKKAIEDLLKDTDSIGEESRKALEEAIGVKDASKYFKDNLDGTYTLDTAQLRQDVKNGTLGIYGEAKESLLEGFASLGDEAISAVTNATQLITQGTNKQADMQKIVNAFNGKYSQGQLFKYDDILNAYTFNPAYLQEYQQIQAKEYAKAMGVTEEQALKEINKQTQETLASKIDINSFLKAENRGKGSQARDKLTKQLKDYYRVFGNIRLPDVASFWPEGDIEEYYDYMATEMAESDISILEAGGQLAVEKAKELAEKTGQELSSEDIESYFYSEVNRIKGYADSLTDLTTGQYVAEGDFKQILRSVGMIDSSGMVANIENMAAAYKAIYDKMGKTGESTAAQLNEVYAKYLTEAERGDIDAIAAMGDAMGMTYDTLGQILAKSGTKLEDWINDAANQSMFERIGAGKIRITDFTAFAAQQGWQPGSEEYTSAFKSYNDSLIELNKKTKESIYDEVAQIESAKVGDQLNLTELYTKLNEATVKHYDIEAKKYIMSGPLTDLQSNLNKYSATLANGILTLGDNANLLGVAAALQSAAETAGSEMTNELADMLQNILKAYTEAIINGIKGGLNNVQAEDLRSKASDLGITDISFVETTDGLKLAQTSAIQLYNALKGVDSLQAKLVFDELNNSLKESNEHYKSISDIQSHIVQLRQDISEADAVTSGSRIAQYEQELALAEEILAVRSTSEDASFSFMSNKIPGAQNNPINYFNDWAKAIHTFNDALKNKERGKYTKDGKTHESGFVDYQDWYNLVTEMNNIAALGGPIKFAGQELDGSLEAAAALIQKGADSLVATSTGEIKVALSGMSLDFEEGADAFSGNVTEGIQAMAESQVSMLDGMIQLLETVVAMEKLGDITGDNDTIDIGDLFPNIDWESGEKKIVSNQQAFDWINEVLLPADKDSDLGKALDSIIVNGKTLREFAQAAVKEGLTQEEATNFSAVLDSLYKMYTSGEYNLDDLYSSIQQIMGTSNFEGTVRLGDNILHVEHGATVIETTDKEGKTSFKTPSGTKCDSLDEALARSAIEAYHLDKDKKVEYDGKMATGTITFKNGEAKVEVKVSSGADGNVHFTDDAGNEANTWTDYIKNVFFKDKEDVTDVELNEKVIEVGLQTGAVKLDSHTYKTVGEDIRAQLEQALASGNQVQVDKIINENDILSQLKGLSMDQIAQKIGLDTSLMDNITRGIEGALPSIIESLNNIKADGPQETASALGEMLNTLHGLEAVEYSKIAEGLASLNGVGKFDESTSQSTSQGNMLSSILTSISSVLINQINPDGAIQAANAINSIKPDAAKAARSQIEGIQVKGQHVNATANITVQITHGSAGFSGGPVSATGNVALASGTRTLMGELGPELVVSNGHYFLAGQMGAEFVNLDKDAIVFNHKQTERLFSQGAIGSRGKPFTNEQNAISFAKGTSGIALNVGTNNRGYTTPGGTNKIENLGGTNQGTTPADGPTWGRDWGYTYTIRTTSGGVSGHLWQAPIASISLAKGNVKSTGPAKASASAALAALRQLRAQWQALAGLSTKDLAGKGGGGGGGGGKDAAFIKDLERWYNLLQEIAKLEQEITYQETLRNKLASDLTPNGSAYAKSQAETLAYLQREVAAAEQLSLEQEDYFKKRQAQLNKQSAFSKLYTFDDEGQIKYASGQFAELSKMFGGNDTTGKPNYSVKQQYNWLISQGYGYAMQYDESGNKIKVKKNDTESMKTAIEAFWAKIEADKNEMQELHDSVEDQKKAVLEKMQEQNELLKEIEDNQISVENKVLKAVEDVAQREIDKLDDQKNAIEKSNQALIDGLSNALDKERQLYENSESERELDRKRRQLDILRRSGGSAAEIANLQADIDQASRDLYFDKQQEQIDAIQAASDEQLQKLNNQIDLMKESLEYQKEHGLLWNKVAEIMSTAPEDIANYIKENTKEYWGKSPTDLMQTVREDLFEAQQYVAYRDTVTDKLEVVAKLLANQGLDAEWDSFDKMMKEDAGYKQSWSKLTSDQKNSLKAIYGSVLADTGDPNAAARAIWESDLAKELGLIKQQQQATATPAKTTTTSTSKTTSSTSSATRYGLKMVKGRYQVVAQKAGKYKTKAEAQAQANSFNSILDSEATLEKMRNSDPDPIKSASGGYVNHGIYELGELGTETVFTASQTKVLRDNILSNRPNSLISLLKSYNEGYKGLSQSTYDSISNKSVTTTIERAEVNLQIEKLANDYDSKRAANTIMDEMLRIASKTSANNSVRR